MGKDRGGGKRRGRVRSWVGAGDGKGVVGVREKKGRDGSREPPAGGTGTSSVRLRQVALGRHRRECKKGRGKEAGPRARRGVGHR